MKDDEEYLREICHNEEDRRTLNNDNEFVMAIGNAAIEREARQAANEQCRGVEDVGVKVEHFGHVRCRVVQYVLNIFNMSSGTEVDEYNTKQDKRDVG